LLTVQLIVWNSEGAEWDMLWNYFISPHAPYQQPQADDIVALVVESGWPPWVQGGIPVNLDVVYRLKGIGSREDPDAVLTSAFCLNMERPRSRQAYWVPWVKKLADLEKGLTSNSRCSMGVVVLPKNLRHGDAKRFVNPRTFIRPVVQIPFGTPKGTNGYDVTMVVMAVHLMSAAKAKRELQSLFQFVPNSIPGSTPAFIAGDFNIDLATVQITLPDNRWSLLNPGVATRRSGKILDWALLYNPTGDPIHATVQVLNQYESGVNRSDHSVLGYTLDW